MRTGSTRTRSRADDRSSTPPVLAPRHADIVEIGGLGRTLPDGHFHEPRWTAPQIARVVDAFHDAVGARDVRLGALVQFVAVTDQAEATATGLLKSLSEHLPPASLPSLQDVLSAPFVLIGTVDEIADKVLEVRHRWGIDRYTVRAPAIDDITRVLAVLRSRDHRTEPAA